MAAWAKLVQPGSIYVDLGMAEPSLRMGDLNGPGRGARSKMSAVVWQAMARRDPSRH